jgi:hypothetical protein
MKDNSLSRRIVLRGAVLLGGGVATGGLVELGATAATATPAVLGAGSARANTGSVECLADLVAEA